MYNFTTILLFIQCETMNFTNLIIKSAVCTMFEVWLCGDLQWNNLVSPVMGRPAVYKRISSLKTKIVVNADNGSNHSL